jgi:hypothetical protein
MSHHVDFSDFGQEDNSSLALLRVHLAHGGIRPLQGNQECLVDLGILHDDLRLLRDVQTLTTALTPVHPRVTEVVTTSNRLARGSLLLIQKMKERPEIVGSKCEEANLGNYLLHD